MGRASQEQARQNRQAVVEAASRLLRARGMNGIGVRELMGAAGLTQGAFTKQFSSKDALAAEACAHAFEGAERAFADILQHNSDGAMRRFAEKYLQPKSADHACPMARLASDVARSPDGSVIRTTYAQGLGRLVCLVAGDPPAPDRLVLLAALVGGALLIDAAPQPDFAERVKSAIAAYSETLDEASG